ncbi:MAG: phosphoribosylformylglycinamidine synthase, partial [Desulfobacteraceae bacterium]|nr:phosphoribosylformylglycinamidine synthase [Desulfobacteraceae bacterium]
QIYKILEKAIDIEIVESCHAVARGGLAIHLALTALSSELGLEIDLSKVPKKDGKGILRDDRILFSESAGRFIITIAPENKEVFEKLFKGLPCSYVGMTTDKHKNLVINGCDNKKLTELAVDKLETAFTQRFGDKI